MGSTTTAALGILAVTAVGEQTEKAQITKLAADPPQGESPAVTVGPGVTQSAAIAVKNSGGARDNRLQAWPSPVTDHVHHALNATVQDIAYNATPLL